MASTSEQVNTTTQRCFAKLLQHSPYLLMEVRDMLAEDGMLYDDVCLGTSATTQRSDTCEHSHNTVLLKDGLWNGIEECADLHFVFPSV